MSTAAPAPALQSYVPQPPLSAYVACLWAAQHSSQLPTRTLALPTGTMELVIALRDEPLAVWRPAQPGTTLRFRDTIVIGAQSAYFGIVSAPDESVLGVHFKPGGAAALLPLRGADLHDGFASLDDVWGASAAQLRERLLALSSAESRLRLLEQCLLEQLRRARAQPPAVASALRLLDHVPHGATVAALARHVGLSQRHFIAVFRDAVGLTPKQYARVSRFQAALRAIGRQQSVEWATLALACGYYDQAHLINDFQRFTGRTPRAYLRQRSERLNHIAQPA